MCRSTVLPCHNPNPASQEGAGPTTRPNGKHCFRVPLDSSPNFDTKVSVVTTDEALYAWGVNKPHPLGSTDGVSIFGVPLRIRLPDLRRAVYEGWESDPSWFASRQTPYGQERSVFSLEDGRFFTCGAYCDPHLRFRTREYRRSYLRSWYCRTIGSPVSLPRTTRRE